jgi:hypothetical protein
MYVRSHEWLPPGGHVQHRRLQAAAVHHGAFKAPLRKTGISSDYAREIIRSGFPLHPPLGTWQAEDFRKTSPA